MTMENQPAPMLLIADSHVQPATEREDEFFQMLNWISSTDCDVFFLGDNLDLWIASGDRYEADVHRRFLAWCEHEKKRRRVLMVEGNHEFYLKRHHDGCFTACSETFYKIGDVLFMHGDVAQKRFGFHRCFRVFAKNAFGDWVMGWLPFGPSVGSVFKQGDSLCVVESVKAASDVFMPIGGKVVEVNTKLEKSPELVNADAEGDGWICVVTDVNADELAKLMDEERYLASLK